jgi:uncharacterized protein
VNLFDPERNSEPPPADLPAQPPAEPVYGEPVLGQNEALASAEPGAPAPPAPHLFRWRDLLILALFYLGVGAVLFQLALAAGSAILHTTPEALQKIPTPYVAVVAISQALLSAAMLALLLLMVRSRSATPFWSALGWHAFPATPGEGAGKTVVPRAALAVRYLLGGATLAVLIQIASFYAGTKSSVPMEDLFRDRPSVMMMMALGILVAPLIEETLFRGCIYPVVARTFGIPAGIVLTGTLFGLAHSLQLAGAWSQVGLVTIVGIVLTYVRARTGTVLAGYFVHLGYNTLLFIAFYFATGGLRHFPVS